MKALKKYLPIVIASLILMNTAGTLSAKRPNYPDTTTDGLERLDKTKSDVVYLLPGADLAPYDSFILKEPHMAFEKGWQDWYNSSANMLDRITDSDMAKMLERGKETFMATFTKTLKKKGYPIVEEAGPTTLIIEPSITDIEVTVPDPDKMKGMGRGGVYAEHAGEMTFTLELYDSVSGQILLRAIDTEEEIDYGWRIPRDYYTNKRAAERTYDMWAKRLANGLDKVKKQK